MNRTTLAVSYAFIFCMPISEALAIDYVGRALTTCSPLKGTKQGIECIGNAAKSICGNLQPQESISCFKDFERYHVSEARKSKMEREAFNMETERRIERLRAKAASQQ